MMFGGLDIKQGRNFRDTWEFDGHTWTRVSVVGPTARFHHIMVYDVARARVVLFGGNTAEPPLNLDKFKAGARGDTWEWDGRRWTEVRAFGPARRDHHAMAYDQQRRRMATHHIRPRDRLGAGQHRPSQSPDWTDSSESSGKPLLQE